MKLASFFTGIGGFDLGFEQAGTETLIQCERDKNCLKLLETKFPNAKRITDINDQCQTEANRNILAACAVWAGGFPCQDLSVAGARAGLAGERSGLWFRFRELIADFRPPLVVIENVPGLLSSQEGRDFAVLVCGLEELGYGVAWRSLDAQFFGLAQRRERVFIVASLGNLRCAQILFEPESLCRDTPPSRQAGEEVAPTIGGVSNGGGANGPGRTVDDCESLRIAKPLGSHHPRTDLDNESYICGSVSSKWAKWTGGPAGDECDNLVSHALRSEGADASEDGTGQGTPIIPILEAGARTGKSTDDPRCSDGIGKSGDPMFTLQSGKQHAVAFGITDDETSEQELLPTMPTPSESGGGHPSAVAFTERTRADGRNFECQEDLAYALTNPGSGGRTHSRQIAERSGVRRLTPLECERLQGFPDNWTAGFSDSTRYRMIGNAVAVPVARWLGARIAASHPAASGKINTRG